MPSSLFPLLLLLLLPSLAGADTLSYVCGTSGNYSANSTYQSNLRRLLSALVSNGSASGFLEDTMGQIPDQIYGHVVCQGDINSTECRSCLDIASQDVQQLCPFNKDAMTWYDFCFLRFSNLQFHPSANNPRQSGLDNTQDIIQPNRFGKLLLLLNSTADWAVNSTKKFATGELSNFTLEFPTIYSLLQCTPDMLRSECRQCLETLINPLPLYMGGKQGGRVIGERCSMRYDVYSFFEGAPSVKLTVPLAVANGTKAAPAFASPLLAFPAGHIEGKHKAKPMKRIMFGGFASAGFLLLLLFSLWFSGRHNTSILNWTKRSRKDQNFESYLKKFHKLVPTRYSYSDVEEITNSFSHKLGQGGYSSVFIKGKLEDGRHVAVKVLNDSKGTVKDFFNEVIAIGCTHHANIVTLLGFCAEGTKRILIYEFMCNGSLEKFIYNEKQALPTLSGEKLLQIAIGVARGLEYLHQGCNIGILHFDIKPHNILLDHNFCPNIVDFGLAKLCRSTESFVKVLGTRGTIGYIAPEVFSHSYGEVSSKSDVYSFGMLLLEMVGSRKKFTGQEDHSSEIYFPHWICKPLYLEGQLKFSRVMTKVEEELARRMVLVGLRCIQTKPLDRPSMTKVLDMLEGRITELQLPPMPILSSPTRSAIPSLTIQSHKNVSDVTS